MTADQIMTALGVLSVVISIVAVVWVAVVAGNTKAQLEIAGGRYGLLVRDIESVEREIAAARSDIVRLEERERALLKHLDLEYKKPNPQPMELTVVRREDKQ